FFCFFFQAEDGIRGLTVTGVQTCALPICLSPQPVGRLWQLEYCQEAPDRLRGQAFIGLWNVDHAVVELQRARKEGLKGATVWIRSEERRVGKGCGGGVGGEEGQKSGSDGE